MDARGSGADSRGVYHWRDAEPANTLATTSGAFSPRVRDPLAAQIVAGQLASPSCPAHLRDDPERWRHALNAWGRAEAQVELIRAWLDGRDVEDALSEAVEATETTTPGAKGAMVKRTSARRRESALAALDRAERTARNLRNDLGLTPAAAARIKADLAPRRPNLMQLAAQLVLDDRAAAEREARDDQPGT
ncbi:MAG: P27 family phage terminase small subunit [Streptosporangiaceae bacterium]